VDVGGGFLDLFGKPPRESACECERSGTMMLGPVLNLVNGPVIGDAVRDPNNRIAKLLAREKDDARVVEELYLAVLCRVPTKVEMEAGLKALREGEADFHEMLAEADRRRVALAAYEKGLDARQAQWEAEQKRVPDWVPLEVTSAKSKGGAVLTVQKDGSVLASGKNPSPETYTVTAKTKLSGITGIRLEALNDPSLPVKGPGRAGNGNFVLNELKVAAQEESSTAKPAAVALHRPQATFAQDGFPVANAIDNNPNTGWAVMGGDGKARAATAYFELQKPVAFAKGAQFTVTMQQRYPGKDHNVGRFRLSVTTSKPPLSLTGPPPAVAAILNTPPAQRTAAQKAELTRFYRAQDAELARLSAAIAEFGRPVDKRQPGAQDLVWALLNSKAFQFNH
jgi:hypothetical protein